jgi:putative ATP-binding cassette transporter
MAIEYTERRRRSRWFREFLSLVYPYWKSEQKLWAGSLFFGIIATILGNVYFMVRLNSWYPKFYETAGNLDYNGFLRSVLTYIGIMIAWTANARFGSYLRFRLKLGWREWMTRRFTKLWLEDQSHYFWNITQRNSIDNPDQRITEDVNIFINTSLGLTLDVFERLLQLGSFIGVLWGLSGAVNFSLSRGISLSISGYLVWLSLGYALLANYLVYRACQNLVPLQMEQQHREADFRHQLMKLRENSESIAIVRGEQSEIQAASTLFKDIVANFRAVIRKLVQLEIFDEAHRRLRFVFSWLIAAPKLFSGSIKVGGMMQIADAFQSLENSVALLVTSFKTIADWRAATRRLSDFQESLNRAKAIRDKTQSQFRSNDEEKPFDHLIIRNLTLATPQGRKLIASLNLEVKPGEKVLLKGKSGLGKSTLFRTLSRIWPFYEGTLQIPPPNQMVFIAQSPYLPSGTLRRALLYPQDLVPIEDEKLKLLLAKVDLPYLCDSLDRKDDWQKALSPGERQRLVIIRLLLIQPRWIFLDEATSSLDAENQIQVFKIIHSELPQSTIISIGHRKEIEAFHNKVVHISSVGAMNEVTETVT